MKTLETYGGEVKRSRSRITGTVVVLLDCRKDPWAGREDDGGRWMTLCDEHSGCVQHETRKLAESHMADPTQWCPDCSGRSKASEQ